MSKLNYKYIGANVKRLREALGLSQHNLSTLIPVSKRTIANIEAGNPDISIAHLNLLLEFFNLRDSNDLSKKDLIIKESFREKLISYHEIHNPDFNNLLNKTPTIVYAVKYKLLNSLFFKEFREIIEIRSFFEEFGWEYKGSSITNALIRMPNLIERKKHESKGNTNLYKRREE